MTLLAYGVSMASVNADATGAVRILALGDSLTAGFGLAERDGFTPRLEAALRAEGLKVELINAGVSGDTSRGGLARLDWALESDPDAVLICLGANDALRGLPPELTESSLDAIIEKVRERGLPVLLSGMKAPPNLGSTYVKMFNAVYPRVAKRHGVPLHPFFLEGVAAVPELNQNDGIHPNAKGVGVVVQGILPYARTLAAEAANAKKGRRP